ncbi:hypothetical protein [Solirubrum puertoriconensis]|uniref:STAS/SEC14 domain-containing protein n=1 Tax=Solirubrum puertoriconensis TaxID=1751427 RepID=A0A9X0L6M9_SOLP1|nr:hypothetical protein [Solirubrum puertoriconensis]KUG09963.1 hypothetical protein ASU33_20680 [Solirubrum puertoriconensis]
MPQFYSLHESPGITISHDKQNCWLYMQWLGNQNAESIREGCLLLLHYLHETKCVKLLNDDTHVTIAAQPSGTALNWQAEEVPLEGSAAWVGSSFYTMLADAGLQYIAWVNAPSVLNRRTADLALAVSETVQLSDNRPLVATFDDLASAYEWLQKREVKRTFSSEVPSFIH